MIQVKQHARKGRVVKAHKRKDSYDKDSRQSISKEDADKLKKEFMAADKKQDDADAKVDKRKDEKLADKILRKDCLTKQHKRKPKLGTGKRFANLEKSLSKKNGKSPKDEGALAAFIGRKKFGAKKFAALSHK